MSTLFRDFPYNKYMEIFSKKLKELRIEKGLSQKELAKILKTNNSSVCDWERERSQPDLETLVDIAKYFNVSTDYLLGIKDY